MLAELLLKSFKRDEIGEIEFVLHIGQVLLPLRPVKDEKIHKTTVHNDIPVGIVFRIFRGCLSYLLYLRLDVSQSLLSYLVVNPYSVAQDHLTLPACVTLTPPPGETRGGGATETAKYHRARVIHPYHSQYLLQNESLITGKEQFSGFAI